MGFVDDDEVPRDGGDLGGLGAGELVRADDDLIVLEEGRRRRLPREFAVALRFDDDGGDEELLGEFLAPLLAERRGRDDEDAPLLLGPELARDDAGLDGLAKAHFVGEDGPSRERRAEGEERGVHLVRDSNPPWRC